MKKFNQISKSKKGDNSENMVDRVMGIVSYDVHVDGKEVFQLSG